jgi:hypothetical protein
MYEFSEGCSERPRKDGDISLPFPRRAYIIHSPTTLLPDSELETQSAERNSRVETELPESRIRLAFLRKSIILFGVLHRGGRRSCDGTRRFGRGIDRERWSDLVPTVEDV